MHLLIDTNVIIDYVCHRQAFEAASIITNNKKDFVSGVVPVLTPAEYCGN